jgi:hypothetical protein
MIICRAMISKLTGREEQGRVQSFVASLDALVPVIVNPVYGIIYRNTLDFFPGVFFLVSAGLSIPPLVIFMYVTISFSKNLFKILKHMMNLCRIFMQRNWKNSVAPDKPFNKRTSNISSLGLTNEPNN